jgi:hypothetical protein
MPKLPWKKSKENNPAGAKSSLPPVPRTTEPTHSTSPQAGPSAPSSIFKGILKRRKEPKQKDAAHQVQLAETESTTLPVPLSESTTGHPLTPSDPSHRPPSISPPSIEPSSVSGCGPSPSNPATSAPKLVPHQNVLPVTSKHGKHHPFFCSRSVFFLSSPDKAHPPRILP